MKRYDPENDVEDGRMREASHGEYVAYSDANHEIDKRDARIDAEIDVNVNLMSQLSDEELKNIELEKRIKQLEKERTDLMNSENKLKQDIFKLKQVISKIYYAIPSDLIN